jgi:hypothetical protein
MTTQEMKQAFEQAYHQKAQKIFFSRVVLILSASTPIITAALCSLAHSVSVLGS